MEWFRSHPFVSDVGCMNSYFESVIPRQPRKNSGAMANQNPERLKYAVAEEKSSKMKPILLIYHKFLRSANPKNQHRSSPKTSELKHYQLAQRRQFLLLLPHGTFANPLKDSLDAICQSIVAKVRDAKDSLCSLEHMEGKDFQLYLCTQSNRGKVSRRQDQ
jgi:hypothetical protein